MRPRLAWLLPLLLIVSACQWPGLRGDAPDIDEPDEAVVEPVDVADEPGRLAQAIEHLQDGEVEQAERLLSGHLAEHPDHRLASRLLEQVREEPRYLLGDEYEDIVVQPGDTLSQLAARHAGDGMLFFALARLNHIERPRLLRPGTVLRVPATAETPGLVDAADVKSQAAYDDALARAEMMLVEGEAERALDFLIAAADQQELDADSLNLMTQAAVMASEHHMTEGRLDEAMTLLDRLDSYGAAEEDEVALQRNRIKARERLAQAEAVAALGDGEAARELLQSALELDPALAAAAGKLAHTRAALVNEYHDRALKAWREQEVETAVDYWEQVLDIDPEFAPAQIYLERGQEVLRRLEAL